MYNFKYYRYYICRSRAKRESRSLWVYEALSYNMLTIFSTKPPKVVCKIRIVLSPRYHLFEFTLSKYIKYNNYVRILHGDSSCYELRFTPDCCKRTHVKRISYPIEIVKLMEECVNS